MPAFIRRPDLSELETLVLAADRGSIAEAAEALRISRVAASKRIKSLETIGGSELLRRSAKGVELTEAGRRVYAHALDILAESDALLTTLGVLKAGEQRSISGLDFLIGLADEAGRTPTTTERLVATEHLAAELFHASPVAIAVIDPPRGVFDDVNTAFERLMGIERREILGRTLEDLGLELLDEEGRYVSMRNTPEGRLEEYPLEVAHDGDGRLHVTVSTWPIRIGELERRFCVIHDTSEISRVTRDLTGLTMLADHVDRAVCLAEIGGTLVYANAAFRKLFGIGRDVPIETVTGRSLISLESFDGPGADARAAIADGRSWRGRLEVRRASGRPKPVDAILLPVPDRSSRTIRHTACILEEVAEAR